MRFFEIRTIENGDGGWKIYYLFGKKVHTKILYLLNYL